MALNLTRAKLAEFTDTRAFEQMCSSLLVREYLRIIPLGGSKDRGRDAIEPAPLPRLFQSEEEGTIFQFSTEQAWESKLKRELEKIFQYGYKPTRFVFVTNQVVGPIKYDELRQFTRENYGIELQLYDLEWLRTRLESPDYIHIRRQYLGLDESGLPVFLSTDEYSVRRLDQELAPDLPIFLNRESEVEQIERFVISDKRFLVLSGLPGFGKTKLLLEVARKLESGEVTEVRFIRPEAESIESHFNELDPKIGYLFVLDDAHEFEHFRQLFGLLASPEFKDKLHIIISTHPWAKDNLKREFERLGHTCDELYLTPLANLQIDQLIQHPTVGIADYEVRNAVITIAEGNPLIAITAARFWKETGRLAGLTRYQLISAYFSSIFDRALKDKVQQAHLLLAIFAATGGLSPGDPNVRQALSNVTGLSEGELDSLIDQLVSVRLIKRTW